MSAIGIIQLFDLLESAWEVALRAEGAADELNEFLRKNKLRTHFKKMAQMCVSVVTGNFEG